MHDCIKSSGLSSILETPKDFPIIWWLGSNLPEGKRCHYYFTCGCFITPLAREMLTFLIYYQPFIMSSELSSLSGRCGREYRLCGGTRGFWCTYTTWDSCLDLISPVNTSKPQYSFQELLEGFQLETCWSLFEWGTTVPPNIEGVFLLPRQGNSTCTILFSMGWGTRRTLCFIKSLMLLQKYSSCPVKSILYIYLMCLILLLDLHRKRAGVEHWRHA